MKNKDVKSNIYKKFKLEEAEEAHKIFLQYNQERVLDLQ